MPSLSMEKMRRTMLNAPTIPHSKPKILTEIPIGRYRKKDPSILWSHVPLDLWNPSDLLPWHHIYHHITSAKTT